MKPNPVVEDIPLKALLSLVHGPADPLMTDKDFLEQLAVRRCFLVPPWILRAKGDGGLERVALITFDRHLNVDKPKTLANALKILDDTEKPQERARDRARRTG